MSHSPLRLLFAACLVLIPFAAQSGRIADLNPDPASQAWAPSIADLGGLAVFAHHESATGWEPWISDGTPGGTRLLADLRPGPCSSSPRDFTAAEGQVFFVLEEGESGRELWRTDGTPGGTLFVSAQAPEPNEKDRPTLAAAGSRLFYRVGLDPWVSDGTPAGTQALSAPSLVGFVGAAGGRAYFTLGFAEDEVVVYEGGGTAPYGLFSIGSGAVEAFEAFGERMLVLDSRGAAWLSEGTAALTEEVACCSVDSWTQRGVSGASQLYYLGEQAPPPPGRSQFEPEVWDESGGSRTLANIAPDDDPTAASPLLSGFLGGDSLTWFAATDEGGSFSLWRDLWVTDGTAAGTLSLSPPVDLIRGFDAPLEGVTVADRLFFQGWSGRDAEPWLSDGTSAGTRRILDLNPTGASTPVDFAAVGARAFFFATLGDERALVASDGTQAGTAAVAAYPPFVAPSSPASFAVISTAACFIASDGGTRGLWCTDGTEAGTQRLLPESVQHVSAWGDLLAIVERAGDSYSLWSGDGSPAGSQLVGSFGFDISRPPSGPVELNGQLLWDFDGRLWSSRLVPGDLEPVGDSCCGLLSPALLGDRVVYHGASANGPFWLRVTDGTEAGTRPLVHFDPGTPDASDRELRAAGGAAWFAADDGSGTGVEPWWSDGTVDGTLRVADVNPAGDSFPRDFSELDGRVWFHADDGVNGRELWASDGTPGGTVLAVDVRPGGSAGIDELVASAGRLFFTADDGANGRELWVSDGTPAGTTLVVDLRPGPEGSEPRDLVATPEGVAFVADDGVDGLGVWSSDGTDLGTVLRARPAPGASCTTIEHLTPVGGELIFAADDGRVGTEPWVTGPLTFEPPPPELRVSGRLTDLATALAQMHEPAAVFAPVENAGGCGRTRLGADRRFPVDAASLDEGIPVDPAAAPLELFEISEWCGCSLDPAEPPPADASQVEATLIVRKSGEGLVATALPDSAGRPCP